MKQPIGYVVGHSGEYHYFRHYKDAEREKEEQERISGEACGDIQPVYLLPEGFQITSKEPTQAMIDAALKAFQANASTAGICRAILGVA